MEPARDLRLTPRELEEDAREALDEAIGEPPRVHVVPGVMEGHAAEVLIDASRDAQLLSHGHGGFAGMLLGSISLRCVSHAHCPVVVIRRD